MQLVLVKKKFAGECLVTFKYKHISQQTLTFQSVLLVFLLSVRGQTTNTIIIAGVSTSRERSKTSDKSSPEIT